MTRSAEFRAYEYAMEMLASSDAADFEQLKDLVDTFPQGCDELLGRSWIRNAVDGGSIAAVKWILDHEVDLSIRDHEGCSVLEAALDRDLPDKHEILELLLSAGAPVNAPGTDDCSPVHVAAARNDVDALRLFARFGADFPAGTRAH